MNNITLPHKLVLVLQDLEFGGTQRYAVNLLQHLDRELFDPELWVLRGGMDMAPLVAQTGVKVKWLSTSSRVTPLALYRLFRALLRNKPTFLYPLTVVPNIWARIFGKILGVPVIVSSYRSLHAKQFEGVLSSFSTHTICNAEVIRKRLIRCYNVNADNISVVVNGVDSTFFCPNIETKTSYPVLLFSGRLEVEKDPLLAIKIFQIVHRTIPAARMIMAGNGKLAPELRQFVKMHSLEKYLTFLPGTVDVRNYLQESWVLLLSSRSEASPNILIEAMSCELPVVASRVGGIPEIIEHGVNGYLASLGKSSEFAESIIFLLNDEKLRIAIGKNARSTIVKKHNLKDCVCLTEEVFLDQLDDLSEG